jgi:lactoylglutathione lyase
VRKSNEAGEITMPHPAGSGGTRRLAHVALWTRDLDRLCDFWAELAEVTVGPLYESRNRPGYHARFLHFADGASLEVMTGPWVGETAPHEAGGYAHVALSLGSSQQVDLVAARHAKSGTLVSGPRRTGDGYYEAVIRDPDGNLVEITA